MCASSTSRRSAPGGPRGDLGRVHLHVKPPSTGSAIPVTYRAAGEASQSTASLTSRDVERVEPREDRRGAAQPPDLLEVRLAHPHQVVEHRRVDDRRADRVDGDAVRARARARACASARRRRAWTTGSAAWFGMPTSADVDETRDDPAAALAALHVARRVLRAEERPLEVDVDGGVPLPPRSAPSPGAPVKTPALLTSTSSRP